MNANELDIVTTFFRFEEKGDGKYRPGLVLDIHQGKALVAPITSKRTTELFRGEVAISPNNESGLTVHSKIQLEKRQWVALADLKVIGHLPVSIQGMLLIAAREARLI